MTETPEQKNEADLLYRQWNNAMNKAEEMAMTCGKLSTEHKQAMAEAQKLRVQYEKLRPITANRPAT